MMRKSFKTLLYLAIFFFLSQFAYALNIVELSPGYYPNTSRGRPLATADIYVGKPDLDPTIVANQKTLSVQQEDGTIIAVSQPVHTNAGGVPQYAGSPVVLLVEGDYSLKVLDSHGTQIYYVPSTAYEKYLVSGNYYYPDYAEADQGVIGGGETITDILAEVGTTENATMYFSHNSGGNTTTYTFTTATTITDNYNIIVEKGAIFAGALTINKFPGSKVYPEWWGENAVPGTTDMTAEIQAAVGCDPNGGIVFFHDETYLISAPIIPESNVHFKGTGTIMLAANSDDDMFDLTGTDTDIKFEGLTFDNNAANQTCSTATNTIHATTQVKRLSIINCKFLNAASSAIILATGLAHEDIVITGNKFIDYYQTAVSLWGTSRGKISDNIFDNTGISPVANGNAISVAVLAYHITISDNVIMMGDSGAETFGITAGIDVAQHLSVTGNVINCGDYAFNGGISVPEAVNVTVTGNTITKSQNIAAIEVSGSSIVSVSGNTIYDIDSTGIALSADNHSISVTGNSIDAFTEHGITIQKSTGTFANIYGISIVGNTLTNSTAVEGAFHYGISANGAPKYGLVISSNSIYNISDTKAIVTSAGAGDTMVGTVVTGNIIYDCTQWITIHGAGTHTDYVVTGNSVSADTTVPSIAGTGHIFANNGSDEQSLTGVVTLSSWQKSGNIDSNGGAVTGTLGSGLYIGQIKTIVMTDASTSSTITVTHHDDFGAAGNPAYVGNVPSGDGEIGTFDAVDEAWILMWTGTEWTTLRATCTF